MKWFASNVRKPSNVEVGKTVGVHRPLRQEKIDVPVIKMQMMATNVNLFQPTHEKEDS